MTKFITIGIKGEITGMYLDDPGDGVELSDEDWSSVGPGYTYIKGKLIPPAEPTQEEIDAQNDADKRALNISKKDNLLLAATQKIVVWQTKLLMGRKLTAAESSSLNAWVDYIDGLNEIKADVAVDIEWPSEPN